MFDIRANSDDAGIGGCLFMIKYSRQPGGQTALTWGRSSIFGACFWVVFSMDEGAGLSSEVGQSVGYSIYMPQKMCGFLLDYSL